MQLAVFMLARAFPLVIPLVALLVFPSCGGKSVEAFGADGGGTTAGQGAAAGASAGGAAQGGSLGGGTDAGGTGVGGFLSGGGSGGSTACEPYLDQAGTTVQVELVNHTQEAIYLGPQTSGCGGLPQLQVADANGALSVPGFCEATCQNVIQGTTPLCPPLLCPVNATLMLQPGESTPEAWGGAFLRDASLPLACRPSGGASDCQRIEGVTPGVYTFSATAGTQLDCSQLGGAPCQACIPNSDGGCLIPAAVIAGPFLVASTEVTLDGSYGVGGAGVGGAVRAVQLIFGN